MTRSLVFRIIDLVGEDAGVGRMSIMSCQVVLNAMVVPATAHGRTTTLTTDRAIDRPGLPGILSRVLVGSLPQDAASGCR